MHKLRTIDVWDTLLRRKAHPDFSKLISARALSLSHGAELNTAFKDPWAIFRERCAIEGELAHASPDGDGEYKAEEVLARLLERILPSRPTPSGAPTAALAPDLAGRLAELELQYELRQTYPDPSFASFSQNYPAQKSLFLSDFYMSGDWIKRLLQHHGLHTLVQDGISSCDVGLNKRSGKLFRYVHEQLGVSAKDHVHIGDNPHADVQMPNQQGIQAVLYEPKDEHAKRQARAAFLTDRQALFRHIHEQALQRSTQEAEQLQGKARTGYLLGVRSAPLLVGFILYIAERALLDKVERLYFFTREGEFYRRVWQALFPGNHLAGLELPPADLLEVSRLATFCASLRELSTGELMRLWNLYSTQSMFALLKTLGLNPDNFSEVCSSHGLNLKDDVVYPWQDARVQALFHDPRFREPIEAKIADDRSKLLDYLNQRGWSTALSRVGIVDIGWRGTIQDNLAYLQSATQVSGYYMGLQRFLNDQPDNCSKSAFGPDANQSNDYVQLLDAVSLIEMLCNSPNGSVTGYVRNSQGQMSALRAVDQDENASHNQYVEFFQNGVLSACQVWADYVDSHVIQSVELKAAGCEIWADFVSKPDQDLAETYGRLSHNEVFGVGKFVNKSEVPSIKQLFQGLFDRKQRHEVILYIRQTQWVAGIWGRKDLGLVHKTLLATALFLARCYKRFRYFWRYR